MTAGRGLDERGFIAANANRSHIVCRCRNRAVLGVVVVVIGVWPRADREVFWEV